jgi:hypothetical protein
MYYRNNYMPRHTSKTPPGFKTRLTSYLTLGELKRLRGKGDVWTDLQKHAPLEALSANVRVSPYGCTDLGFREI